MLDIATLYSKLHSSIQHTNTPLSSARTTSLPHSHFLIPLGYLPLRSAPLPSPVVIHHHLHRLRQVAGPEPGLEVDLPVLLHGWFPHPRARIALLDRRDARAGLPLAPAARTGPAVSRWENAARRPSTSAQRVGVCSPETITVQSFLWTAASPIVMVMMVIVVPSRVARRGDARSVTGSMEVEPVPGF
jgi:hypothetical protein